MLNYLARLLFDIASGLLPTRRPVVVRRGGIPAYHGTSVASDRAGEPARINSVVASRMFETR